MGLFLVIKTQQRRMTYFAVIAAQMLNAQLDARPDPLRCRPFLHGLGRRTGVFLDTPASRPAGSYHSSLEGRSVKGGMYGS